MSGLLLNRKHVPKSFSFFHASFWDESPIEKETRRNEKNGKLFFIEINFIFSSDSDFDSCAAFHCNNALGSLDFGHGSKCLVHDLKVGCERTSCFAQRKKIIRKKM